jgi:transposase-like protein
LDRQKRKKMFNQDFSSLLDVVREFSTEERCMKHLEELYWQGEAVSPFDEKAKVYKSRKAFQYVCGTTKKKFSVLTGTMFQGTRIPLVKWFAAIYLIISHKKGISSVQLAKDLGGISQKTAWLLLHKIREALEIENYNELGGQGQIVEADESFYGGKNKNRHAHKKVKKSQGRSFKDKTAITGMVERGGRMTAVVTVSTAMEVMQPVIRKYLAKGSVLISDDWKGYIGLDDDYHQYMIKDSVNGYSHEYDSSIIHTNTIEGSWKIMKNSLRDMYNCVSRKHLQRYVNEFVFRYNTRKMKEGERFNYIMENLKFRFRYKDLVNA